MLKKVIAASCLLLASNSYGSGFSIQEQSARAQGYSFAGATASAEDASYMFFNPAAITYQCGYQVSFAGSYIIPNNDAKDAVASTATQVPITGSATQDGIAKDALVPAFYFSAQLPNCWWAGLGVNAPFGLSSEYSGRWVGRYHGVKSTLKTVNIDALVGWRPTCWLSVAMGPTFQYADVELTSALDIGSLIIAQPAQLDGKAELNGDSWGYGAVFGAIIEPNECLRFGISYRTQVLQSLEGDADFTIPDAAPGAIKNLFANTTIKGTVKIPDRFHVGVHYQVNSCWALMAEYEFTKWSKFQELRVVFGSALDDSVVEEHWRDTSFFAVGTSYTFSNCMTFRTGIAYDQSPVPNETRTPRIPDSDRFWLSSGLSYDFANCWGVDIAATYIWVDDTKMNLVVTSSSDPDATRGNLSGNYESSIGILSVSVRKDF